MLRIGYCIVPWAKCLDLLIQTDIRNVGSIWSIRIKKVIFKKLLLI